MKREVYSTLDFPKGGLGLAAAGFISSTAAWANPETTTSGAATADIPPRRLATRSTIARYEPGKTMTSLTLFFIVEPRTYQYFSCFLGRDARGVTLTRTSRIVGYCPEHRMGELDPSAVEALARMDCEVRPMQTKGVFDPPYPHGNKLAACLAPRDTDWGRVPGQRHRLCRAPMTSTALLRPGHVTPARSRHRSAGRRPTCGTRPMARWVCRCPRNGCDYPETSSSPSRPISASGIVLFSRNRMHGQRPELCRTSGWIQRKSSTVSP